MTRSHDAKTDHVDGTIRETNAPLSVSDIQGMLSRSRKGMVIQSASNCAIVLREDPVLKLRRKPGAESAYFLDWGGNQDLFMVAPATADVLAKFACGICDDMLTTTVMACTCKKIIAPAMNHNMFHF